MAQWHNGVFEKGETGRLGDWGAKRLRDEGTARLHDCTTVRPDLSAPG